MGSDVIVFFEPSIDRDLRLFDTVEPFCVSGFMAKDAIEAFVVAVFPRTAWIDLDRLHTNLSKPILKVPSNELAAII